ncbi:MAG TPA: family 43 glycosylhydrolase [bacterium]|nr:family 43 glycosylhydrolase [bacterium]HPN45578.1 family 43 glycosylhydrolase [bacterium]
MKKNSAAFFALLCCLLAASGTVIAENPFITDQFTADPTARVFNGKVYVYPSHDILAKEGMGRPGWFCMEDYHVFSSANLTDWTDHGVIVTQTKVDWVDASTYSMWAPDCIEKNGKYYFYFPAGVKKEYGRGSGVGVAIAEKPEGPYIPQPAPIKNLHGIDPNIFIDKDGQAYIYWAMGNISGAKLTDDLLELASEPQIIAEMPKEGLKEGPFLFERNGIYYMTYPHVQNKIERLEYAIGDNPMGPFKFTGVIMDESPTNCWTNHQSIVEYNQQWYLFYHHNDISPQFDKNRSIRVDSLFFNADGTIKKVTPTLRGVGLMAATKKLQLDRYTAISGEGASIAFLDTLDKHQGWQAIMDKPGAWFRYNSVDFGKKKLKKVTVNALSAAGGVIEIRIDKLDGPVIAVVTIPKHTGWTEVTAKVSKKTTGVHNLFAVSKDKPVAIDWLSFE